MSRSTPSNATESPNATDSRQARHLCWSSECPKSKPTSCNWVNVQSVSLVETADLRVAWAEERVG